MKSNMTGLNSTPCPKLLRFDLDGTTYHVWMNPAQYYETDNALVTCAGVADPIKPSTSKCNKWNIGQTNINEA